MALADDRSAADGLPPIRPAASSSGSLFTGWAVIQSPSVAVETVLLPLGPIDWRRPLGNKSECGRRVVPPPPPSSGRAWGRRSSAGWIRMLVPPCHSPSYAPSHKIYGCRYVVVAADFVADTGQVSRIRSHKDAFRKRSVTPHVQEISCRFFLCW
jgi:hypothetical protein